MSFLEAVEFNIMQPMGVNVIAFLIKMTKREQWNNLPLCTLEKLEYVETAVNGRIQRTFSIPYGEDTKKVNVLIASLAKNRCTIGYGKVLNNVFVSENETIQLEYMNYTEADVEARNYTFTYNPKRQMVLIDTKNGEQVIPEISRPDIFGNLKGVYKLVPYRKYIALEMNIMVTLSPEERKNINIEDLANVIL